MKKRVGLILICFLFFISHGFSSKADEVKLYAKSAVLMDASTGRVLYGKNENEILPMASTTKIMTCILALEYGNEEDLVTFSKNAASMPKVHLGAKQGEQFYLKDLLFSLMLESHNDSAVAIAEHIGGSMEGFAEMMNQKARDLNCNATYFITPNGLDAVAKVENADGTIMEKCHSTTAVDLAKIMRYCLTESDKKERFIEITSTKTHSFNGYYCTNHNTLFQLMDGAVSGKTGYTSKAGYCYVGAVEKEGNLYIVALLACGWPNHKTYKWSDMKALISYAVTNYKYYIFPDTSELNLPDRVRVLNARTKELGDSCTVGIKPVEDESNIKGMLLSENDCVNVKVEFVKVLYAPVKEGEMVGSVIYNVNDIPYKIYHIMTDEMVKERDYKWALQKIIENFSLFCLVNR